MGLADAATYAGVHRRTLVYAIEKGRLKAQRIGNIWVTTPAALDEWHANAKHRPGPAPRTQEE